jgi:hypothetical protein
VEKKEQDFDIHGLKIPAAAASMIIAHGDSMKSLLMMVVLGTLAQRGKSVLYLDWEWTAERYLTRKHGLFGAERLEGLRYLKRRGP